MVWDKLKESNKGEWAGEQAQTLGKLEEVEQVAFFPLKIKHIVFTIFRRAE